MIDKFTDDSIMPFGEHKGKKLINVPAHYLLYLYDNGLKYGRYKDQLKQYIKENLDALKVEAGL